MKKIQVLILDDLRLEQLSNAQCDDLMELIEDRYGQSSTIVVSQFPVDILQKFYQETFHKKLYVELDTLQSDIDE
ncbi:hypothetical protein D9J17_21710 [Escherichia coli]|nr:hypothetical protein F9043_23590 [Escherichia coli]KAB3180723.1 hypothetical protein F9048_23200 [Escherichia coli]KAB3192762.1 hypothetical protein F9044_23680 [Escherichia coli]MKZ60580.1 hypothetical protein [Escherichia coli]